MPGTSLYTCAFYTEETIECNDNIYIYMDHASKTWENSMSGDGQRTHF